MPIAKPAPWACTSSTSNRPGSAGAQAWGADDAGRWRKRRPEAVLHQLLPANPPRFLKVGKSTVLRHIFSPQMIDGKIPAPIIGHRRPRPARSLDGIFVPLFDPILDLKYYSNIIERAPHLWLWRNAEPGRELRRI